MNVTACSVIPLHVGNCTLGERHVLGDQFSDENRIDFALYAFLIHTPGGERVLVDLGPKTLRYTNDMFRRFDFFRDSDGEIPRPDDIRQPHGNIHDHLERLGIKADDIAHIVFTHLHADHHGMDDARDGGAVEDFKRAVFHGSRVGWDFNLARRKHDSWDSYIDYAFGDCMMRLEKEGRFLAHDNAEIVPGVRTVYLGGHSICSQAVCVDTLYGTAVITSDDMYRYDLLQKGTLARLYTSPENLRKATDRLVEMALDEDGILLPVHDPALWELWEGHGPDWLKEAKQLSREAAESYRRRHQKGEVRVVGVR